MTFVDFFSFPFSGYCHLFNSLYRVGSDKLFDCCYDLRKFYDVLIAFLKGFQFSPGLCNQLCVFIGILNDQCR